MSELSKDYGEVGFDNLVIEGGAVGSIQLAANQGTLKKGSVIDSAGKLLTEGGKASYVLCDATATDSATTVTGIVYKTGTFVRNSLVTADGYEFKDTDAESLRDVGIIVEAAK